MSKDGPRSSGARRSTDFSASTEFQFPRMVAPSGDSRLRRVQASSFC